MRKGDHRTYAEQGRGPSPTKGIPRPQWVKDKIKASMMGLESSYAEIESSARHRAGVKRSPEQIENMREGKRRNPGTGMTGRHHTEKTRRKISETRKRRGIKSTFAQVSYPQKILFEMAQAVTDMEVKLEYTVITKDTFRIIDVAIPSLKLGFEYDGARWHKKPNYKRDLELAELGWTIVHFRDYELWYIS